MPKSHYHSTQVTSSSHVAPSGAKWMTRRKRLQRQSQLAKDAPGFQNQNEKSSNTSATTATRVRMWFGRHQYMGKSAFHAGKRSPATAHLSSRCHLLSVLDVFSVSIPSHRHISPSRTSHTVAQSAENHRESITAEIARRSSTSK